MHAVSEAVRKVVEAQKAQVFSKLLARQSGMWKSFTATQAVPAATRPASHISQLPSLLYF